MAAPPQAARVPVEVYLRTSYEPDAEYVDGVILALSHQSALDPLRRRRSHHNPKPTTASPRTISIARSA